MALSFMDIFPVFDEFLPYFTYHFSILTLLTQFMQNIKIIGASRHLQLSFAQFSWKDWNISSASHHLQIVMKISIDVGVKMTNKRAKMKIWNVIIVCVNNKAVSMHLAPGYSTDDFFIAYNSHVYVRGVPATVHSDKGSQLVAAGKEVMNVDWDTITKRCSAKWTI